MGMRIPVVGKLSNRFAWAGVDKDWVRTANSADIKSKTVSCLVEEPVSWESAGIASEINSLKTLAFGVRTEADLADMPVVKSIKVASRAKRQGEFNTKLDAKAAVSNFSFNTTTLH